MMRFSANQSGEDQKLSVAGKRVPRIGELLVAAGAIETEVLNKVLQIAKSSKTLIGRTLVSVGQIDEPRLQAALYLQALIRQRSINAVMAVRALTLVWNYRLSAQEALTRLGWKENTEEIDTHENEFAQFLLDCGLITAQVLATAEQQSIENHLPLGRCLVVNRYVTQNRLESVLILLGLVKDNLISLDDAAALIKQSIVKRKSIEHCLFQFAIQPLGESERRLLDILASAGCISETARLVVLERSLVEQRSASVLLIESEMTNPEVVDNALLLQEQVLSDRLTLKGAANLLQNWQEKKTNIEESIAKLHSREKMGLQLEQLLDLFRPAGILTDERINNAEKMATSEGKELGDILLAEDDIDVRYIEAAWQWQRMVDDKLMTFENAIEALRKMAGTQSYLQGISQQQESLPSEKRTEESLIAKWKKKLFKQ